MSLLSELIRLELLAREIDADPRTLARVEEIRARYKAKIPDYEARMKRLREMPLWSRPRRSR